LIAVKVFNFLSEDMNALTPPDSHPIPFDTWWW
jgi:hypothetical protein